MKEELDERSDLKENSKTFLNGSSIFREATSPFDRGDDVLCLDFFLFVFVGKWGDEKQTRRTQIVPPHTGHVQL